MEAHAWIPQPPIDSVIDPAVQYWVTGFMAACAVITLIYSLLHWRRSGKPTFLLLFIAGGAMMLMEPMVNVVGGCWHHALIATGESAWIVFTAFGRPMPLWLCLAYLFYFGIGIAVTWEIIRRGATRKLLWSLFIAGIVGDFVLEVVLLHFDTWVYYGWQPLVVLKFPLWWAPVNALIVMAAAAAVHRFESRLLHGWGQLLIVPAAVSVSAAVNCMAGWPSWTVINSDLGSVVTQLGGIATFALAFWFMAMLIAVVAQDAPTGGRVPAASLS